MEQHISSGMKLQATKQLENTRFGHPFLTTFQANFLNESTAPADQLQVSGSNPHRVQVPTYALSSTLADHGQEKECRTKAIHLDPRIKHACFVAE